MAGALPSCLHTGLMGARAPGPRIRPQQARLQRALGPLRARRQAPRPPAAMPAVRAVAEAERASSAPEGVSVSIDNSQANATVISVEGYNRPGLLTALTATFRDLGLDVNKARDLPQITLCCSLNQSLSVQSHVNIV